MDDNPVTPTIAPVLGGKNDVGGMDSVGQENSSPRLTSVLSQPHSFNPILLENISADTEAIKWVWEGFIAKGHKTLFSALWKSGKSTFIATLLRALQDSEDFCGKPTCFTKTLIISEESKGEWVRRKNEFQIVASEFIWVIPRQVLTKMSHREWVAFLKKAADFCVANKIGLVIIDTLSSFWPISDENNATDVQSALIPLNQLLEEAVAVLLVHHHRKGGGDQGQASRGSGALGADVDILVDFERLAGNPNSNQRKLSCLSRFEETPKELIVDYNDCLYTSLGTLVDVVKEEKHRAVITILKEYKNGTSADQVLLSWDDEFGKKPSKRSVLRYLQDLSHKGKVIVQPSALSNVADIYLLKEICMTRQTPVYKDGTQNPHDTPDKTHKISDLSHGTTVENLPDEVKEILAR